MSKEKGPIRRGSELIGGGILALTGILGLLNNTPTLTNVAISLGFATIGSTLVIEGLE